MRRTFLSFRGASIRLAIISTAALCVACAPSSLVDVQTPDTVVDPSQVLTATGAEQLYQSALGWFNRGLASDGCGSDVVCSVGLFTDELMPTRNTNGMNERMVSAPANITSSGGRALLILNIQRVMLQRARQGLQLYAPRAPLAWQARTAALEGLTVLWFAENFCSGIPLTLVPLNGSPVPTAGSTTQQMFDRAIALFDSAAALGVDSTQIVNLAKVLKGRALLDLGRFAAADSAVRGVPTDFVYLQQFSQEYSNDLSYNTFQYRVQDHEGGNGLVWSTDPRTATVAVPSTTGSILIPTKYYFASNGVADPNIAQPYAPMRLGDGLEARLIQAEVALQAGDPSWLTTLNALRLTCVGSAACAPVPGITTTNLPDTLTDPGTPAARLDLLMKERAMWLYLTGHREGDLRRMAHLYQRSPNSLWPVGTVTAPAFPPLINDPLPSDGKQYGNDVVWSPDPEEKATNPAYGGCYDTNP